MYSCTSCFYTLVSLLWLQTFFSLPSQVCTFHLNVSWRLWVEKSNFFEYHSFKSTIKCAFCFDNWTCLSSCWFDKFFLKNANSLRYFYLGWVVLTCLYWFNWRVFFKHLKKARIGILIQMISILHFTANPFVKFVKVFFWAF